MLLAGAEQGGQLLHHALDVGGLLEAPGRAGHGLGVEAVGVEAGQDRGELAPLTRSSEEEGGATLAMLPSGVEAVTRGW